MNSLKFILLGLLCLIMSNCSVKDKEEENEPKLGKKYKLRYEAYVEDPSKFFMEIEYDDTDHKNHHDIREVKIKSNSPWSLEINSYYGYPATVSASKEPKDDQMNGIELLNDKTFVTVKMYVNDVLVSSESSTDFAICGYTIGEGGE